MKKVVLIFLIIFTVSCGRQIEYDNSESALGKTIVFSTPMLYSRNWKSNVTDSESEKYNRYLIKEKEEHTIFSSIYIDDIKAIDSIRDNMKFVVVKSYRVIPYGLQTAFSSEYRILVLRDENYQLATLLKKSINDGEWIDGKS